MSKRTRKPYDPAKVTAERLERQAELARLKAQGAEVTVDKRTGQVISARRSNVFNLLLARGTITQNHHNAAYRLAEWWAAWKGLDGKGAGFSHPVDGSSGSAELVTDRMLSAGRFVSRTLQAVSAADALILGAFMVATVEEDRAMAWRGIMERLGYHVRERQTDAFVGAVEALRAVVEGERRAA